VSRPRLIAAALAASALAAALPASAQGHAVLERTVPERGADLEASPPAIELYFNEPVEASFGAVRVFDSTGEQVDTGEQSRPGADPAAIGVGLPPGLADGTYTATYRVISADSHPVSGGFVFTVGDPGAAPTASVSDLLSGSDAGPVTGAAAGVTRFLTYAATAFVVGGLLFALLVFGPAAAGRERAASAAFDTRLRRLVAAAALIGLAAGAAGIVLQGATATGTSFWNALVPDVVGDVLETRFGTVWGLRELAWLAIAGVAVASAPSRRPSTAWLLVVPTAFLCAAPALAGHASTQSPRALLIPADIVHVAAMSLWVGGIAALLVCVRAATARLEPAGRTRLLAASLARFSPLALAAVVALVATGAVQAIVHLDSVSDLWEAGFGRALAVKLGLVAALVAIGVVHRRRSLPGIRAAAEAGTAPGRAGRLVRRALTAEVALFAGALTATAVLVGQPPPSALSEGPQGATATLGEARVDLTVDPARPGSNEVHVYLFDADDGSQYDELRDVELDASLPSDEIGPIELDLRKAGPGHYTAPDAALGVPGEWTLELSGRASRFEAPRTHFQIEIG
jgi:copper transport protein